MYTIKQQSTAQFSEKKSRFISYAFKVGCEQDATDALLSIKKQYPDATHHVYAYIVNDDGIMYQKYSDDKEPAGTAGLPVLEVLKGNDLENVLIIVVRYFGGTLLGTGGLVKAYSESAKRAIEKAQKVKRVYCSVFELTTDYPIYEKLKRFLSDYHISDTLFSDEVTVTFAADMLKEKEIIDRINEISEGRCKLNKTENIYLEI